MKLTKWRNEIRFLECGDMSAGKRRLAGSLDALCLTEFGGLRRRLQPVAVAQQDVAHRVE